MRRVVPRTATAAAVLLAAMALPPAAPSSATGEAPTVQVGSGAAAAVFYDAVSPASIPVSGASWKPGSVVYVQVDGVGGDVPDADVVTVGSDGTFTHGLALGQLSCDAPRPAREQHTITVQGVRLDGTQAASATGTFTVDCPTYKATTTVVTTATGPVVEACLTDRATGAPVPTDGRPVHQPLELVGRHDATVDGAADGTVTTSPDAAGTDVRPVPITGPGPACGTYVPTADQQHDPWSARVVEPAASARPHAAQAPRAAAPAMNLSPTCAPNPSTLVQIVATNIVLNVGTVGSTIELRVYGPTTSDPASPQTEYDRLYLEIPAGTYPDGTVVTYTNAVNPTTLRQQPPAGGYATGTPTAPASYTFFVSSYADNGVVVKAQPAQAPRAIPPGGPAGAVAGAIFHVPCPPPATMTVTPTTVAGSSIGAVVTATGQAFDPNSTVSFLYPAQPIDAGGNPITVTTDGTGHFGPTRLSLGYLFCSSGNQVVNASSDGSDAQHAAQTVTVTCPQVTLSQPSFNEAVEPHDVAFSLSGFDPNVPVVVSTSAGGQTTVTTDGFGNVTSSAAVIPQLSPACDQTYTVSAVETSAAYTQPPDADTSFTVACITDPTLTISPAPVAAASGSRIFTVAATGLRQGTSVPEDFTFTRDSDGAVLATASVPSVAEAGTATWTTPALAGLICGTYTVQVLPPGGDPPGTTTLTVTCPAVALDRPHLDQQALPATVRVTGTGFDPGVLIIGPASSFPTTPVTVTGPGVAATPTYTVRDGSFSTQIVIPVGATCGQQLVTGSELVPADGVVTASTAVTIDCPADATLQVVPSTFATTPGQRLVHVSSTGLRGGYPTYFVLDGTLLSAVPVTSAPAGTLDSDLTLTGVVPGLHTLTVVQPRKGGPVPPIVSLCASPVCGDPIRAVSATLTVTLPTLTPLPASFARDDPSGVATVTGTGWDPGTTVGLALPGGTTATGPADAGGKVVIPIDPDQLACGPGLPLVGTEVFPPSATVTPATPAIPAPTASTTVSVTCPNAPTATVKPSTYATSTGKRPVEVTGLGFRPGVPVVISTVASTGHPATPLGTVLSRLDGSLTLPTKVPDLPCGAHALLLTPAQGYAAVAAFTITCPMLQAQPSRVVKGDTTPDPTIVGAGFDPGSHVALRLGGDSTDRLVVKAGADGSFSVPLPLKDERCAKLLLSGTETDATVSPEPEAATVLTISCLTLTVSPGVTNDGAVVKVTGGGFTAHASVALSWLLPDGSRPIDTPLPSVTTDVHGRFALYVQVITHDVLGPRHLVATSVPDGLVSAPLLVVPNPFQPGGQGTINPGRQGLVSRS